MMGAILLLVPATTFWSAVLLLGICLGAFAAQAGPVHGDLIHGMVLLALPLAGLAWLARPPILRGSRLIAAAGEQ
jgi:hypothetical protein